jgi:hypothetical protein
MPRRRPQLGVRPQPASEHFSVPVGAPSWVTPELIEHTLRVWQPYYADRLTAEDALAMILDAAGLLNSLAEGSRP